MSGASVVDGNSYQLYGGYGRECPIEELVRIQSQDRTNLDWIEECSQFFLSDPILIRCSTWRITYNYIYHKDN